MCSLLCVFSIQYLRFLMIQCLSQANEFLTVSARLLGGKLITDCPKRDLRASIHAKGPSNRLCPHERMAPILISVQQAKLENVDVKPPFAGEFKGIDQMCSAQCSFYFCPVLMFCWQTRITRLWFLCRYYFQGGFA